MKVLLILLFDTLYHMFPYAMTSYAKTQYIYLESKLLFKNEEGLMRDSKWIITHLAPHTGSVQEQENTPMLLHTFDLRVQLYACKNVLVTNDAQDTPKLYRLVSIVPCILLPKWSANTPSVPYHTYHNIQSLWESL